MKINGEMRSLWRAMNHEGEVLESFVTKRRDRGNALKFLGKTMKAGVLEEVVGRLRNHTPLLITGRRYIRPSLDALRPAMQVVCDALDKRLCQ